jgi:hypothetical protein
MLSSQKELFMSVPHDDEPITMDLTSGGRLELDLADFRPEPGGGPHLSPVPADEVCFVCFKVPFAEAVAVMTKNEVRELIDHLDEIQGGMEN